MVFICLFIMEPANFPGSDNGVKTQPRTTVLRCGGASHSALKLETPIQRTLPLSCNCAIVLQPSSSSSQSSMGQPA
jgi:hypothetical protein